MRCRNTMRRVSLGVAICLCLTWIVSAQSSLPVETDVTKPLWTIDLSSLGANATTDPDAARFAVWHYVSGIAFLQPDLLVAYFMSRGTGGKLSRRHDPQPSDPYHLTAVFFDALAGKQLSGMRWATEPHPSEGIYPAGDGRFLLRTADALDLYSPTQQHEFHFPLSVVANVKHQDWYQQMSPDGKTLLLGHTVDSQETFALLRTTDLNVIDQWKGPYYGVSIYDQNFAWIANNKQLVIRTPEAGRRVIYSAPSFFCSTPWFVSQEVVAVEEPNGACRRLELVDLEGKQVLSEEFEGEQLAIATRRAIKSSSQGEFFAVATEKVHGSSFNTLEHLTRLRLRVYNLKMHAWVLTQDSASLPKLSYDFALSPDGQLLAILSDTTVSVYRVPGTTPH